MAIFDVAAAFDDDVGMRLEQADELVAGRHGLAVQHPTLALGPARAHQRQIMVHLRTPALGRDVDKPDRPPDGSQQRMIAKHLNKFCLLVGGYSPPCNFLLHFHSKGTFLFEV